jgi:hypothetical protein
MASPIVCYGAWLFTKTFERLTVAALSWQTSATHGLDLVSFPARLPVTNQSLVNQPLSQTGQRIHFQAIIPAARQAVGTGVKSMMLV